MKAYSKKVITLLLACVMAFGSVLTADASATSSSKVTLIKRADAIEGYQLATKSDKANFSVTIKRQEDQFDIYQLVTLEWTQGTVNGNTVDNLVVNWQPLIEQWLKTHKYGTSSPIDGVTDADWQTTDESVWYTAKDSYFNTPIQTGEEEYTRIFSSPTALGNYEYPNGRYTTTVDPNTGKQVQTPTAPTKAGEAAVIDLLRAMRADTTLLTAMQNAGLRLAYVDDLGAAVNSSTYSSAAISKDMNQVQVEGDPLYATFNPTGGEGYVQSFEVNEFGLITDNYSSESPSTTGTNPWFTSGFYNENFTVTDHSYPSDWGAYEAYVSRDCGGVATRDNILTDGASWDSYFKWAAAHPEGTHDTWAHTTATADGTTVVSYTITGAPYGLYFINAKSTISNYQPTLLDLLPMQVGPNGNWYLRDTNNTILKYEDINVYKTINDPDTTDADTAFKVDDLGIGDYAHFYIESDIPKYPVNADGTLAYSYKTFTGLDEMTDAFNLITSSAKIYYKDAKGITYKADVATVATENGMLKYSDAKGTYTGYILKNATSYVVENDTAVIKRRILAVPNPDLANQFYFYTIIDGKLTYLFDGIPNDYSIITSYNEKIDSYIEGGGLGEYKRIEGPDVLQAVEKQSTLVNFVFDYEKLMNEATFDLPDEYVEQFITGVDGDTDFTVPVKLQVYYDATLSKKAEVNSDGNTNRVDIYYVADSSGRLEKKGDEVNAYTYRTDVIKTDGAVEDETKIGYYLAGAEFDIYQLDTTYCCYTGTPGSAGVDFLYKNASTVPGTDATTAANFKFYEDLTTENPYTNNFAGAYAAFVGSSTGITSDLQRSVLYGTLESIVSAGQTPTAEQTAQAMTAVSRVMTAIATEDPLAGPENHSTANNFAKKYKALDTPANSDILYNWLFPQVDAGKFDTKLVASWVDGCYNCNSEAKGHWHIEAYTKKVSGVESIAPDYSDTDQEEIDNAIANFPIDWEEFIGPAREGTPVKGFGTGTYLLVETKAPAGYNLAAGAMRYEMNTNPDEEGSRKTFLDDGDDNGGEGQVHEDGVYDIKVQDFKGITLPSTGGIGTLIFTILGIAVMTGAILFILAKRKQQETIGF